MRNVKRYAVIILGFIIVGTGCAFTLKANVGVGAWDAFGASLSEITHLEVGTCSMILNISCCLAQIIILRKNFKLIQLLQVPLSILLGLVINFVLYDLLVFEFNSFIGGIIMYILATEVCALGVSIVMLLDEVTFALEGMCNALTTVLPLKFHVIRQSVDFIVVGIIVILTLTTQISWTIGVGTIIGMLIFGPSLGIMMKVFKPILKKQGLLNYE